MLAREPGMAPGVAREQLGMASVDRLADEQRAEMIERLKRIEGQARGVQKMVEDGRECVDILNQLSAIRAAVSGLSGELLECFAMHCLTHPDEFSSDQAAIEAAVKAVVRGSR